MSDSKIKHVVADSGAFIRNAPLQNIGLKIYTVPKVVNEIKDKATLQRLQVLPYQLIPKTPTPECIKIVTEFSKKTGDYKSLSSVDIHVIALTYQLEKENVGSDHIKTVPDNKIEWTTSKAMLEKPTSIAGFYLAKDNSKNRTNSECTTTSDLPETESQTTPKEHLNDQSVNTSQDIKLLTDDVNQSQTIESKGNLTIDSTETSETGGEQREEGLTVTAEMLEETEEDEGIEEDGDEDDDDDDGWITPSNITSLKQKMTSADQEKVAVPVGCVTTDFAMQNVLIQMGLNVISVDGLLIKRAKSFVLRCFACMKITKDMMKEFCPYCGNRTLQKVSMTVEEDGSIRYFLSRRKPISTKGMKHQIPLPRGGKHSNNPILTEDQPMPQQRAAKKKQHLDVFDPDYVSGQSPFALNDITSRSAQLGIRNNQFNKRHQNSNRHGRRK
ncbi:RNA-binding protein NOB1-like [Saccostrea echinata]|uniref:RNA-binding protein NOB1-like n=1 Tax=Saccostrea echinata TaxID=191078 RepID=UPI002A7EA628|nr:RNA-binding protein NOB1-like [Saccostrea echinata]